MNDIEFGLNLPSLIIVISFIAAFASVMAVALPFVMRDSFANRLKSVAVRREDRRSERLTLYCRATTR